MLGQRPRRWANVKPALGGRLVYCHRYIRAAAKDDITYATAARDKNAKTNYVHCHAVYFIFKK